MKIKILQWSNYYQGLLLLLFIYVIWWSCVFFFLYWKDFDNNAAGGMASSGLGEVTLVLSVLYLICFLLIAVLVKVVRNVFLLAAASLFVPVIVVSLVELFR